MKGNKINIVTTLWSVIIRGFLFMAGLLDFLIQRVTNFTVHCYTHIHTLVFTVTYSLPFLGSGFQPRTFPFLWVPELSSSSATSFYQQQLTTTEPQQFSN
jgi:hypothetical protein